MTKNDLIKAAAAANGGKVPQADAKKIKHLVETFPALSEEEAALLLQSYQGSLKLAAEAALNGERWSKVKAKKPVKEKVVEVSSPTNARPAREPRVYDKDKKPTRSTEGRFDKKASDKDAVAKDSNTEATVHQTEVSTTSWVKGKSISFADMLKKKNAEAEAAAAPAPAPALPAAPAPSTAAPSPKVEAKPTKVTTQEVKEPVATKAAEVAATTTVASTEAAVAAKPRRDRKTREAAPAETAVVAATPVAAPAVAAPAAPVPAVTRPAPVKYVLEIDRVDAVTLPNHVADLNQRFGSTYTFDATPGRAPTPPPQATQQASHQHHNFAVLHQQQQQQQHPRQAWPGETNNIQRLNNQAAPAPVNAHWENNQAANAWGRPAPSNFTTYNSYNQQPQQQLQFRNSQQQVGYRYGHHNVHHSHQRHPEQVASDVAYSAIREEQPTRFNHGVW